MWKILTQLWNRTGGHVPSAPPTGGDAPTLTLPLRTEGDGPEPAPFPVLESQLKGYSSLEIIGHEYEGPVFRAVDPTGQAVTLRDIAWLSESWPASAIAGLLEPFRSLRHPHLLRPLACLIQAGKITLVTKLADDNLGACLERCRGKGQEGIPAAPLAGYLSEAAEALDYLQEHRVCHQRLRPVDLVLLDGHLHVAGYVTIPDGGPVGIPVMSPPLSVLQFAAPEEWANGAPSVTSHQYKLGVVYYYLRTGRYPFDVSNVMELAVQVAQGTPHLSALPEAERSVVQRAMARKPSERYGSCVELVQALKRAVAPACVSVVKARGRPDAAWLAWNGGTVRALLGAKQ